MDCGVSAIRCFLIIFNVLCAIGGACIVAFSAFAIGYLQSTNSTYYIIAITIGCLVFLVSLMGCCGAMCHLPCFLLFNAIFLAILIGAEMVVMYNFTAKDFQISSEIVQQLWNKELEEPGAMAMLEQQIKCCGLHSPQDYVDHNMTIPSSCYEHNYNINPSGLFTKGCWEKLAEVSVRVGNELKSIYGIVCSIELIATMFACFLAIKTSRSAYQRIR